MVYLRWYDIGRISELEEEVSSEQERVGQLQVEKEKVLADLIAIRKINSSIEKSVSITSYRKLYTYCIHAS